MPEINPSRPLHVESNAIRLAILASRRSDRRRAGRQRPPAAPLLDVDGDDRPQVGGSQTAILLVFRAQQLGDENRLDPESVAASVRKLGRDAHVFAGSEALVTISWYSATMSAGLFAGSRTNPSVKCQMAAWTAIPWFCDP